LVAQVRSKCGRITTWRFIAGFIGVLYRRI